MNAPIGLNGNFKAVPVIPANLTIDQIHLLIPPGFDDIIEYDIEPFTQSINITILTDKNKTNTIITINQNLYNPEKNDCYFPRFLIEQSHKYPKIDYLTDTRDRFIFNQNELLYICLQHRLSDFKKYKDAFSNLISNDITAVMDFINYIPNTAYNAIQRDKHSYILLSVFNPKTGNLKIVKNNQCLGTILKHRKYSPNKTQLIKLLPTLPLHFSSESMGEKSKYVLHDYDSPLYRSVGHKIIKDGRNNPIALSLFPPKQNIPARTKTHITSNAYPLANFVSNSKFIQDFIPNHEKQIFEPKDNCYRKTLCVIHPMLDNGKFLYGEVYASQDFVSTEVIVRETLSDQLEEIYVEKDKSYKADKDGRIKIALNIENKELFLDNCISAKLTHIIIVGTLGVQKLVFQVVRHAGNARIDSNTGLKGVTTCRNNLGTISIPSLNTELKPELVFGMNSFKAKGNGIMLARAALAVELGLYHPKHTSGLLNTWDVQEINNAANSLPEYSYIDSMGNKQEVQIGIVYARFTELCYVYKSYGHDKPFSFEAGRVLHSLKDKRLFNNIWDNYVVEDYKKIVIELEKILLDKRDIFEDGLPIYTMEAIRSKKIFEAKDLILNIRTATESSSRLLDESWNKEGFFINFIPNGGKCIRIPCAKTLKKFCTQTNDKMYMYPPLLIEISKIISCVLNNTYQLLFPNTDSNYAKNHTPIIRFYRDIKGLLYSSEEAAVMLIQKLSRPEVPGFAFKQVTDWILPDNTCVVMCNKTYNIAIKEALGEDYPLHEMKHGFYGLHNRAPFLWQKQMLPVKIWNQDDFRIYLHCKFGIKLEDYINTKWNNDIIIFSNNCLKNSQSDVDGDHSSVFTPEGLEIQECLRNYSNEHVTQSEIEWIDDYIKGELESNDDLIKNGVLVNHTYKLYEVPLHDIQVNRKERKTGFSTFLFRAISAKANIGLSTNDGWIFNMLLDIYQKYYVLNNGKYKVNEDSEEKAMYRLSEEQRDELSFTYTRALQDFVVRGVKHTDNGSEDFEVLFLKNACKDDNSKDVYKLLTQELKLNTMLASKMIFIITWAQETGLLDACGAFLKLYNKGTIPTDEVAIAFEKHDDFIQANTYFGMLLESVYSLRKYSKEVKQKAKAEFKSKPVTFIDPLLALGF